MKETQRNYTVSRLVVVDGEYAVECRRADGSTFNGGPPSEFGTWGLSRREAAVIRSGMTASGRDRRPR